MKNVILSFFAAGMIVISGCDKLEPAIPLPYGIYTEKENYVSFTGAKLTGTIIGEETKGLSFGFYYGTEKDNLSKFASGTLQVDKTIAHDYLLKADISGLESGKRYFYQAAVINNKKEEMLGEVYDFITFTEGPVDFELPSGLKWATCNLGAELPTDIGDYYAWGEIETKNYYDWTTYKYCENGDGNTGLTKYISIQDRSNKKPADGLGTIEASDDAAHVKLGEKWRLPESGEVTELMQHCAISLECINGIYGYKLISKKTMNDEYFIFIPGGGYKTNGEVYGTAECFWTSTLVQGYRSNLAYYGQPIANMSVNNKDRCYGLTIRPVCK